MQIHGLNKTTLLDYPGHVAATIFTGSCNMRCPFCQNGDLVVHPDSVPQIPESDILAFLKKRRSILSGVCITGGEPTLQADLKDFILRIRELGLLVKLDTNGLKPDLVMDLLHHELLDYVAMDIKSSPEHYAAACGLGQLNLAPIKETVALLKQATVPCEFRTTVVKELHTHEDMAAIGQWLNGCQAYFIQSFVANNACICPGYHSHSKETLVEFLGIVRDYIPNASLRGID